MSSTTETEVYAFAGFSLDPRQRLLFGPDGKSVSLSARAFDTLLFLVEHPNQLVEKQVLMKALWPNVIVEENNLNQNISIVRRALGESPDEHRFIITVPGRGFRFVPQVGRRPAAWRLDSLARPPSTSDPPSLPKAAEPRPFPAAPAPRRIWIAGFLLAVFGAAAALGWYSLWRPAGRSMLVVLPVQNLTGDSSREYIGDGLTEALIAQIGGMDPDRMGVIARTSSMAYKQTHKTVAQIGRELGVDYVLETSMRGDVEQLRVTAQLIRTRDQTHMWVRDYDRRARDLLALEDEIGRAVASEIRLRLRSERTAPRIAIDPGSYESYLLGRYHWNRGDQGDLRKSIALYQKALQQDPGNALAYAGLADSYNGLSDYYARPREAMPQAKAAALRAVQIDEKLAAGHNALCLVATNYEWDWQRAEAECRRAIELNPNSADAHDSYAMLLGDLGRVVESADEFRRAETLDPLSFRIYADGALSLFFARQYPQAVEQAQRALELAPEYFLAHAYLGLIYAQMGRRDEAVAEAERAARLADSPLIEGFLGSTYAVAGRFAEARRVADDLVARRGERYVCAFEIGTTYLALGEKDLGFHWIEQAYEDRSFCIPTMKYDPRLDAVRTDPRFLDLIRRVGFPERP